MATTRYHLGNRGRIHSKHGDLHDCNEHRCEKPENPMSVHDLSPSIKYRLRPCALLTRDPEKGFKVRGALSPWVKLWADGGK